MTPDFPSSFSNREDPSALTHSFIVKIWLEEMKEEDGKPVWRGHITHVPSNRREHFAILEDIPTLIRPYLQVDDLPVGAPKWGGLFHLFKRLAPRFPRSQDIGKNASKEKEK